MMTPAIAVMHHRVIGLIVVLMGVADAYRFHPLYAPVWLIALGIYGWSFPFEGPEDVTHRLFSSLAIGGGLFEGWRRRTTQPDRWVWVSQLLLLAAAVFLVGHRHAHHQTLYVTIHHSLFALILVVLASLYDLERARGLTVTTAGIVLLFYFID
jgi:hypothetical protein